MRYKRISNNRITQSDNRSRNSSIFQAKFLHCIFYLLLWRVRANPNMDGRPALGSMFRHFETEVACGCSKTSVPFRWYWWWIGILLDAPYFQARPGTRPSASEFSGLNFFQNEGFDTYSRQVIFSFSACNHLNAVWSQGHTPVPTHQVRIMQDALPRRTQIQVQEDKTVLEAGARIKKQIDCVCRVFFDWSVIETPSLARICSDTHVRFSYHH